VTDTNPLEFHGQFIVVDPVQKLVVVKHSSWLKA
jgi:CubicO group peptidase (beta-lactamase class C family)